MGPDFDYSYLPSVGVSRGVLIGWRHDQWQGSNAAIASFSIKVLLTLVDGANVADCWSRQSMGRPITP